MDSKTQVGCVLVTALLWAGSAAGGGCPPAAEALERLGAVALEQGARTSRFSIPPPTELYSKAAGKPGRVYTKRMGDKAVAVTLAELSVDALWRAINDDDSHDLGGDYLPVDHSEVLDGTPRGRHRRVFEYTTLMGTGRWWVARVWMNGELYDRSGGDLWEVIWEDDLDNIDPDEPPMNTISSKLSPIRESKGSWLLVPVTEQCTFIEYFTWSDPGGFVAMVQPLGLSRAMRDTVGGMVKLADDRFQSPDPDLHFVRPDGTALDEAKHASTGDENDAGAAPR